MRGKIERERKEICYSRTCHPNIIFWVKKYYEKNQLKLK